MNSTVKPYVNPKGSQWKAFLGDQLPESAIEWTKKHDVFRGYGSWIIGMAYYMGETPETATRWILVTDDGGYYKVHASYMLWYDTGVDDEYKGLRNQALWSLASLKRSLKSFIFHGKRTEDPDYQT